MVFLFYILFALFGVLTIVFLWVGIEGMIGMFKNIAPAVSAGRRQRAAIVDFIASEFPDAKTIVDIGSGWGAVVDDISKQLPGTAVIGLEIMPISYLYSEIRCAFRKNAKFIFGDAFKFLNGSDKKFDIGITYLLSSEMRDVKKILSRFKVLIALDFPLPDVKPYKKIKLHHDRFAQHYLYIYRGGK